MLVSKISTFLATWKWLLKEKAATQWRSVWLSSVLFCHWGLLQGWLVDSLTLLQDWYHVAPESVAHTCSACIYLSRSGGSSIKPLEFQPWGESAFPIWWLFFKFVCLTTQTPLPADPEPPKMSKLQLCLTKSTWWLSTALFHEPLSIWEKKRCYR